MVRLDFEQEDILGSAELDLKRPRRKKRRPVRFRLRLTCLILFLFVLFSFSLLALAVVAKTGIKEIPLLSKLFYQIPQPTKTIKITPEDIVVFGRGLETKAEGELTFLAISEKELTFMLKKILTEGDNAYFSDNLQAVIADEQIEIFGLLLKPVKINVTLKIKPEIKENHLNFKIKEVKLGNLSLPPTMAEGLKNIFFADKLKGLNENIKNFGEIEKLEFFPGKLTIFGKLNLSQ